MELNRMTEFFKSNHGINVQLITNYLNQTEIYITVGVLDVAPTIEHVDKMIKSVIKEYAPLKKDLELSQDQHKKMADYETFFRLLRGGE